MTRELDIEKLNELENFMRENKISPWRLLLVSGERFLVISNGVIKHGLFNKETYGEIVPDRFERGQILEAFSKIEFLVNELLLVRILGGYNKKSNELLDILDMADLFSKIRYLSDIKITDTKTTDKLYKLKKVRNAVAHEWIITNIQYDKVPLKLSFQNFKDDLKEVWKGLISSYNELVDQNKLIEETIGHMKKELIIRSS